MTSLTDGDALVKLWELEPGTIFERVIPEPDHLNGLYLYCEWSVGGRLGPTTDLRIEDIKWLHTYIKYFQWIDSLGWNLKIILLQSGYSEQAGEDRWQQFKKVTGCTDSGIYEILEDYWEHDPQFECPAKPGRWWFSYWKDGVEYEIKFPKGESK